MEADNQDFNATVIAAVEDKQNYFDSTILPKVQENYRLHLTCVNNIVEALVRKSLIVPDPYQKDKKISGITCPPDTQFNDNDRASQLGLRLSDYQSMLDYICNYLKFSVDQLNLDKTRKLLAFNATFAWNNLTPNSAKQNTRSLAVCIIEAKKGAQALQIAMLSDSLSKTKTAMEEINTSLNELATFQKERYKAEVRKNVIGNGQFDRSKMSDAGSFMAELKRVFPTAMPKRPFSDELIGEIIQEEISPNRIQLQEAVLERLKIVKPKKDTQKEEENTHEMLMQTVCTIGAMSEHYTSVIEKLMNNHHVLENCHNTFKDKAMRFLRHIFGIAEPEIEYNIVITDKATNQKHKEKLNFNEFVTNLTKRTKYYAGITSKHAAGYSRVNAQKDEAILEFLNKQIADNGRLQVVLTAIDEFFKATVPPTDRAKIKGIKMELTTLKNLLVKANQDKSEYVAYMEEKEQMKKLGIEDE